MKKRNYKRILTVVLVSTMMTGMLAGCGSGKESDTTKTVDTYDEPAPAAEVEAPAAEADYSINGYRSTSDEFKYSEDIAGNTEEYDSVEESGFKSVDKEPLSTFSADVDTASYTNIRRMIHDGYRMDEIPADAVRIEEMINYFDYQYHEPTGRDPFAATVEIGDCPWNEDAKLMMVGMQTENADFSDSVPSNLVFLLDVSGSMYDDDKLPLLQKAFTMLASNLSGKDRVSIVTYAGSDEVLLEGVKGSEYDLITDTINDLEAGGSTAGSDGIITAYQIAEDYFIKGGNNRVILATDGDLNVGLTTEEELEDLISKEKETGVFLSVLGFGTGNIKDNKMETLADKGNGNYAYIDSTKEAKKVLVEELGSTLVTVAKDVKFQVEFNPAVVSEYRLIGYDNRVMTAQDFADDTKDAGEVGAGHSVTVLYEIITKDRDSKGKKGSIDLKYQDKDYEYGTDEEDFEDEWLTVSVRYKEPQGTESKLIEYPINGEYYSDSCSENWNFACAVAEFGMLLKDSDNKGDSSFKQINSLLKRVDVGDDEYKDEFADLVNKMKKRD